MARKRIYSTPPKTAMNQWFRDALAFAAASGRDMTYDEVAAALTKAKLGSTYDKSMVQKMTTIRKISMQEARSLSALTGFPMSESQELALSFDDRIAKLSPRRKSYILQLLSDLEAAEAVDPGSSKEDPDPEA